MNNDVQNTVKRLSFENIVWFTFIIISALDIYGDELLKKELLYNDKVSGERANKVFFWVIIVSILIYGYFFLRNYNDYKKYKTESYQVRLTGSILILVGVICLLYFQITTKNKTDSPSNI